jgi:hypothetical protein
VLAHNYSKNLSFYSKKTSQIISKPLILYQKPLLYQKTTISYQKPTILYQKSTYAAAQKHFFVDKHTAVDRVRKMRPQNAPNIQLKGGVQAAVFLFLIGKLDRII